MGFIVKNFNGIFIMTDRTQIFLSVLKYAENDDFIWVSPTKDTPNCDHGIEIPACDVLGENKIDAASSLVSLMTKTERFEFLLMVTKQILSKKASNKIFDDLLSEITN